MITFHSLACERSVSLLKRAGEAQYLQVIESGNIGHIMQNSRIKTPDYFERIKNLSNIDSNPAAGI
jgi:hypothetical protein